MSMQRLNLDTFLPYKLSLASNMVSDVIANSYRKMFGLRVPEWRLLAVIAETSGTTQFEIGQRTRMDKVTVSRAALAMQARGLVVRHPNPEDGRSHMLCLSPAGVALYRQVVPQALDLERAIFASLKKSELAGLSRALDKVRTAAEACLESRQVPNL